MSESTDTNRLIHETSPYLLQHAHNPVDWYPWGAEALEKAHREDKPILVSIGYAACHWCHVMEHESFEDPETAALMNKHFVNIKVDREERPDIDSIYMTAVQAMTGQGGWPLNMFLLPDGTPFFGGTYFPPDQKAAQYRTTSFKQVLLSIADAYKNRRADITRAGQQLMEHIQQISQGQTQMGSLTPELLDAAFQDLTAGFDPTYGGFGRAPKFPQPMILEFLLRYHGRTGNADARHMLELTLRKMALGGMYDQLGGGFHRYSVDAYWLVPHFEKMLYDNALLARLYGEMFQVSGDAFYRQIATETLDYMRREMLHPDGGFYSTQDADSEVAPGHKEEGAFFTWTPDEVREALGSDAALFCQVFDVTTAGNFEGRSILHLPRPLTEVARVTGVTLERLEEIVHNGRVRLFGLRDRRKKPDRDEKILTAWNGMALRAFATAAAAFDRADYLMVAQRNAHFVLQHLRRADGRVLRSWKDGQAKLPGYLEDYALLADGLLALYALDGNSTWLQTTLELTESMLALFWDAASASFYDTGTDHEALVTRPRDVSDNATPSGTSVAVELLLRLAALTGKETYREHAGQVLARQTEMLRRFPLGCGRMLCAADFALAPVREVALVGDPARPDLQALLHELLGAYRPYIVLARLHPGDTLGPALTPLLHQRSQINGQATAYVCEGFHCNLPVTDVAGLRQQLGEK